MSLQNNLVIYRLTNTITKKVYIGKTSVGLNSRLLGHIRDVNEGADTILHRSIRKHGLDKFEAIEIFCALSEDFLSDLEKEFIRNYDCCILDGPNKGYNMTRGGDGFDSESAKLHAQKQLANGTHPWQGPRGSSMAKKREAKKLEEGRCHLKGFEAFEFHSNNQKERVNNGTHNFQGTQGAARTSEYQKKLVAAGVHVLQGEKAKERHRKMLAEGTHPGTRVYNCPHCQRTGKGNRFKGFHFDKCKSFKRDDK